MSPNLGRALLALPLLLPVPLAGAALGRPAPASFADLAARLLPAVVNISSSETVKPGQDGDDEGAGDGGDAAPTPSPFPPGSPFEKFFRDYLDRQHGADGHAAPRRMQSLGSGFVIDKSGLVVTNNHVIAGADAITVTLQDNTVLTATVVGHDDRTDLALLRVHAGHPLPAVQWGNSDAMRVGDWDLAIGNPFGLGGTVTAGIISARGRDIDQGPYDDFLQTDAPINRGNSGGPLFDMDGDVIGINTAIYSPSGGSIGIGFAIPSDEARLVIDQLREYGHTRRGWIGIRVQPVTPDIAQGLKLPDGTTGALVAGVDPKGPAAVALHTGDVVLRFDGAAIPDMRTLPRLVAETAIGTAAPVVIWRDGATRTVTVPVAELPGDNTAPPDTSAASPARPAPDRPTPLPALGMTVGPVDAAFRHRFGLGDDGSAEEGSAEEGSAKDGNAKDGNGVAVLGVAGTGGAAEAGVRPGDVILSVGPTRVSHPAEVASAIAAARRDGHRSLLVLLRDADGTRWVPLHLGHGP